MDDWWHQGTDVFVSKLKKGDSVLDVGCGGGLASSYLINNGLKVVGVDFSEKMIEIASREVKGVKFLCMDMWDLEKIPEKFRGVYSKASILHLPKKKVPEIFDIFNRKLELGGFLYVAVKEAKPGQNDEQVKRENDFGYDYERFFSFFTMKEMEKCFADSGFEVVYKNLKVFPQTSWIEIIGRKR